MSDHIVAYTARTTSYLDFCYLRPYPKTRVAQSSMFEQLWTSACSRQSNIKTIVSAPCLNRTLSALALPWHSFRRQSSDLRQRLCSFEPKQRTFHNQIMVNGRFRRFEGVYIAVAVGEAAAFSFWSKTHREGHRNKLTSSSPVVVRARRCFLAITLESPGVELKISSNTIRYQFGTSRS